VASHIPEPNRNHVTGTTSRDPARTVVAGVSGSDLWRDGDRRQCVRILEEREAVLHALERRIDVNLEHTDRSVTKKWATAIS
jgi:hypothetical protein